MYIKDGSNIDYGSKEPMKNRYSWGWLGSKISWESRGWKDIELKNKVINRLKEIDDAFEWETSSFDGKQYRKPTYQVMHHMGSHECEICGARTRKEKTKAAKNYREWMSIQSQQENKPETIKNFNGSHIIYYNGLEFRCPAGVYHYIEEHDYNPGPKVIDAIFNGRVATSDEIDGKIREEMHKMAEEIGRKNAEEAAAREAAKSPEQKQYESWVKTKIEQLRKSGAIIGSVEKE
jgi:hypothetical protein